jgi:hypothetical protein
MTFGDVFNQLLEFPQAEIFRAGWNGRGMGIGMQEPDFNSKMGHPYLYLRGVDGRRSPWTPNQLDLFGRDWSICNKEER